MKDPAAQPPKRLTIDIPAADAETLERLAKRNERSVAAEIRLAIRAHLEQGSRAAA